MYKQHILKHSLIFRKYLSLLPVKEEKGSHPVLTYDSWDCPKWTNWFF